MRLSLYKENVITLATRWLLSVCDKRSEMVFLNVHREPYRVVDAAHFWAVYAVFIDIEMPRVLLVNQGSTNKSVVST